jgi:hypothetical protein
LLLLPPLPCMSKLVIIHAGLLVHPNPEANNVEFNVPDAGHGIIWSDSFYENDPEISSSAFFSQTGAAATQPLAPRVHHCYNVQQASAPTRRDMVLHAPRLRNAHRGGGTPRLSLSGRMALHFLLQFIRLLSIALSRWDQMQQDKRLEPVPVRQVVSDHGYSYTQGTG